MTTAYIGSSGGYGLTTASVAPNGPLSVTGTHPQVAKPSCLALSADRKLLYATLQSDHGGVTVVDVSRAPVVRQVVRTGHSAPVHLAFHRGHLVVAHLGDGHLTALPVKKDGTLGDVAARLRHPGDAPRAHQVLSAGDWLVAVDLGADAVFTHVLEDGAIVPHARIDLPPQTGPRHMQIRGDRAYLLGELTPGVTVLDFSPATGRFTPVSWHAITGPHAPGSYHAAEIEVHDDHLYTSNRGEDVIAVLGLDGTLRQRVPTGGASPQHFATAPGGRWLYAANQKSGTVTWLPRDPATGELGEPEGRISVPGACAVAFA